MAWTALNMPGCFLYCIFQTFIFIYMMKVELQLSSVQEGWYAVFLLREVPLLRMVLMHPCFRKWFLHSSPPTTRVSPLVAPFLCQGYNMASSSNPVISGCSCSI